MSIRNKGQTMYETAGIQTSQISRRTCPVSGGKRRGNERYVDDGMELYRNGEVSNGCYCRLGNFNAGRSHETAAGKLADTAVLVWKRILIRQLGMLHGVMKGRSLVCMIFTGIGRPNFMTMSGHGLHADRYSQRITGKQRQPDGHQHSGKFSCYVNHVFMLARIGDAVNLIIL